jgi:hypothetical protein
MQDYSLVLGATAGAQVTIGTETYGPAVALTTPVYTTTLKSYCVKSTSPLPSKYTDAPVFTAAITPVPLGPNAQNLLQVSGVPTSYVPSPTDVFAPTDFNDFVNDVTSVWERNKRTIIIAVSAGGGGLLLILLGGVIL